MFVFKGISSTDMEVIVEEEEQFLGKASQRYSQNEIEGRNGASFEEQGYTVIERPIKLQILNIDKLDSIMSWLDGVGTFEYKNRITTARFYNEIDPTRASNIKVADLTFIRDPFWNKKDDDFVEVKDVIYNLGSVYSEPIIRLEKNTSDKVDITVNNVRFEYLFGDEEYVEINSEEKTVLYNELKRDRKIKMGYDFPVLNPGENKLIIHSGDAKVKIRRKDRWL